MTTEALKSASVTNKDASPPVANTAGQGAPAALFMVDDYITPTSGVTVGSTYRMARVPSTAKIKAITGSGAAMTQGPFDVGVYYSTNHLTGAGAVIDADRFASAWSLASLVQPTNITEESGVWTEDMYAMPLWQAAGLSADPGGELDIVLTSTNTITTGAKVRIAVTFTN